MERRGVLLDDEQSDEPSISPPLRGVWAALAGIAVVVVIGLVSSSSTDELSPPSSTLPDLPTVTVQPSMAEGRIVEATLQWATPVGLGDARQIGGVVEFRDLYWLFGSEDRGLTVWTSPDGIRWSEEDPITITGEWHIDTVHASDGGLAVAVSGWSTGSWKNFIFSSPDGSRWGFREVPVEDPNLAVSEVTSIDRVGEGYVVQGWVGPEPVAQYMPEPFGRLLRDGHARAEVWPDRVRLRLNPGLLVAEIPLADLPRYEPVIGVRHRAVWLGADFDSLETVEAHDHVESMPQRIVQTDNGLYVGLSEGVLMTSIDGSAWDLAPVNTTAFEVVPWAGGLAGAGRSAAPFWWRPGASEAELLMPPALAPRPDHFQSLVAGREVGIGLMERRRPEERSEQRSRPVLVGSNVYRVETDDGLELIRDGQIIWRERDPGSTAKLSDQNVVFENDGGSYSMSIERWMSMVSPLFTPQPSPGPRILHSTDGTEWSESVWDEISGRSTAGDVDLYAAGGFLMVVGTSPDGDSVETVAIGRALD
ncbi:MAG TPA: hypothetical protein VK011_02790 [Acidimicrobiia bacterium]|nr:hypothetical protein [Acidimicrobiia bacterium]